MDGVGRRHMCASYSIHPLVGNITSLGSYDPSFNDKSCINILWVSEGNSAFPHSPWPTNYWDHLLHSPSRDVIWSFLISCVIHSGSQLLGSFIWVYFAFWGTISVHEWHILETNQREKVVPTAAHCYRVKSDLKRETLWLQNACFGATHSWPRLFLLTHLPPGSPSVFLEYAYGEG